MIPRKHVVALSTLGILLGTCAIASAATHTISWSPVTTYTDGSAITGKSITYSVYWSTSASLSSPTAIATGLPGTSRTFDPAALGMTPGATVYFALRTSLSSGEASALSAPKSWAVPAAAAKSLTAIAIGGPSSVNEGATAAFTATASWSDGTTSAVSPTWTVSGSSASISGAGTLTASSVSANQTVTVNASYASGGAVRTASRPVTIVNAAPALTGIAIGGPSSVNEGTTAAFTATASWSDGTTSAVSPAWTVSGPFASISGAGTLTASSVSANQTVIVNASYASGGVARTASRPVTIVNAAPFDPASPGNLRIGLGASSSRETWRLSWDPVTEYVNGQELGAGRTVRYAVYWTRDPSLAVGSLTPIAASTSGAYVDFEPVSLAMTKHEMVYFTLQAILETGNLSPLSGYLPWRVSSKGPAAPAEGKIGIKGMLLRR